MLKFSQVTPPALTVAILSGGNSSEREISLQTGQAIQSALTSLGHRCTAVDPSVTELESLDWLDFDVAVIGLHGRFGEDGQVQKLLESKGVPFTGSDSAASALAFSKSASKQAFVAANVPTPEFTVIQQGNSASEIAQHVATIGYPVVVKPDAEGSSFGVTIVESPDQLPNALATCLRFGNVGIVERAIWGREWTVAVIDDQSLDPICIETPRPFYDFTAKYDDDSTRYVFEPDVSGADIERIQSVGLEACRALGTSGVVRADLMVDEFDQPWVLEVNTIPGMTSRSLVPKAAQRAGISFAQLCQKMIESSLRECQKRIRKSA